MIYHGFQAALQTGVPERRAGTLVDEQFGSATRVSLCTSHLPIELDMARPIALSELINLWCLFFNRRPLESWQMLFRINLAMLRGRIWDSTPRVVFLSVAFACSPLCCPLPPNLRNVVRSYPGFPNGRGSSSLPDAVSFERLRKEQEVVAQLSGNKLAAQKNVNNPPPQRFRRKKRGGLGRTRICDLRCVKAAL